MGYFGRAKTAKEMYTNAQEYEDTQIAKVSNEIDSYVGNNRELKIQEVEAYVFGGITSYGTDNSNIIERANSSDTNYFTTSNGNVNYLNINIMKNMHIKILLRSMARGGDFNNTISINNEVKRTYANNDYDDAIIEYEVDVSNGDIVKITQDTVSGGARCLSIFVVGTSI